ncbi:MAG: hypothetical protein PHC61_02270 [Chitinivibrionales bacterium]|nr:hypothetical protein [Chitinivibrionales bacterium]
MNQTVLYSKKIALAALFVSCLLFPGCQPNKTALSCPEELTAAQQAARHILALTAQRLDAQLTAFARVVTADRDFSMKVLVEKNTSAPEVTELAGKFIGPMGLDLLEIEDSAGMVLSSGNFPANAQTPVSALVKRLGPDPAFVLDNCKGTPCLTLQARKKNMVAEVPFYCHGGLIADDAFTAGLVPATGIKALIKAGNLVIGMQGITSMSEFKGDSIVINNKSYYAAKIDLPFTGSDDQKPVLFLIKEKQISGAEKK